MLAEDKIDLLLERLAQPKTNPFVEKGAWLLVTLVVSTAIVKTPDIIDAMKEQNHEQDTKIVSTDSQRQIDIIKVSSDLQIAVQKFEAAARALQTSVDMLNSQSVETKATLGQYDQRIRENSFQIRSIWRELGKPQDEANDPQPLPYPAR